MLLRSHLPTLMAGSLLISWILDHADDLKPGKATEDLPTTEMFIRPDDFTHNEEMMQFLESVLPKGYCFTVQIGIIREPANPLKEVTY